jgi:putative redox protein
MRLVPTHGACSAMTLRMYADRKGWPLEAATVRLKHGKIHASDCAACETREGMLDRACRFNSNGAAIELGSECGVGWS